LIADFPRFVLRFERSNVFSGPSLYFHQRAIERRRLHASVDDLMADDLFFECVYALLPAWGMHRMGKQAAKVGDFDKMVASFRAQAPAIGELWDLHICAVFEDDQSAVARQVWDVLGSLKVSTARTRIVAGSKALHHVLQTSCRRSTGNTPSSSSPARRPSHQVTSEHSSSGSPTSPRSAAVRHPRSGQLSSAAASWQRDRRR
jgi:hypothetical protein